MNSAAVRVEQGLHGHLESRFSPPELVDMGMALLTGPLSSTVLQEGAAMGRYSGGSGGDDDYDDDHDDADDESYLESYDSALQSLWQLAREREHREVCHAPVDPT